MRVLTFDNIVFSRPAGHDLYPCYQRPVAANVNFVEPILARGKNPSKLGFCSLNRCFVEPSV